MESVILIVHADNSRQKISQADKLIFGRAFLTTES